MVFENAMKITPYNCKFRYAAGIGDKLIILSIRETKQKIKKVYSVKNVMSTII